MNLDLIYVTPLSEVLELRAEGNFLETRSEEGFSGSFDFGSGSVEDGGEL
jgi:hypothetical protein